MVFAGKRPAQMGLAVAVSSLALIAPTGALAQSGDGTYPGVPSTPTTPGSGTLPTAAKSGRASLTTRKACTKTSFPVTVSGRSISRVTIYVNGRLAKRIAVKSTATRVVTKLPTPVATSKITVKVTFLSSTGTKARTFTRTVKRCTPASVKPNFTG
jgi:hypothetical protein